MSATSTTQHLVTPAKAGAHHLSRRFALTVQGLDSRLRGNDEVERVGGAL